MAHHRAAALDRDRAHLRLGGVVDVPLVLDVDRRAVGLARRDGRPHDELGLAEHLLERRVQRRGGRAGVDEERVGLAVHDDRHDERRAALARLELADHLPRSVGRSHAPGRDNHARRQQPSSESHVIRILSAGRHSGRRPVARIIGPPFGERNPPPLAGKDQEDKKTTTKQVSRPKNQGSPRTPRAVPCRSESCRLVWHLPSLALVVFLPYGRAASQASIFARRCSRSAAGS